MDFYSAQLFVLCLVDDGRPRKRNICDYPFVIFRARGFEHAFARALALGHEQETTYANIKHQSVRWVFVRVEEITLLGKNLDGREVGSLLDVFRSDAPIPFRRRFRPEKYQPQYSDFGKRSNSRQPTAQCTRRGG